MRRARVLVGLAVGTAMRLSPTTFDTDPEDIMTTGFARLFDELHPPDHRCRRIVCPDGDDPRIIEAAYRARRLGLAEPILLGDTAQIAARAAAAGFDPAAVDTIDPRRSERFDDYAAEFAEQRQIPLPTARSVTTVPFYVAALMVASGEADGLVAGAGCSNQEVLMATELAVGTRPEVATASSLALVEVPNFDGPAGPLLVLADTVVNPEPNAQQLADIALDSADHAEQLLGWDPQVAMLSHATHSHPLEPGADHVCRAVDILRRRAPGLKVDGELQVDAALDPAISRRKLAHRHTAFHRLSNPIGGRANVLIFPDLNAANIAAKLAKQLAGATIAGPILQGFAHPVGLVSRGAYLPDILATFALTNAAINARRRPGLPRLGRPPLDRAGQPTSTHPSLNHP